MLEIFLIEAVCSYYLNRVLFCLRFCSLWFLFGVCSFVCLAQTSSLALPRCQHDPNADSFLFWFVLFSDETVIIDSLGRHRNLSFGTWDRDPHNCDQKIGGGWWYGNCAVWSNLNGLYFGNKTSRAIYWSMLGNIPEESIPKSAEMKIRPVDFVSSFQWYID